MTLSPVMQVTSPLDAALLAELLPPDAGWMVSAELAARAPGTIGMHYSGSSPLYIDPKTPRLDPQLGWSLAADQKLKPAYRDLSREYLVGVTCRDGHAWHPRDGRAAARLVENTLAFEDRALDTQRVTDNLLFGIDKPTALSPSRFVAPYALLQTSEDVSTQKLIWQNTPSLFQGRPVDWVVAAAPRLLRNPEALAALTAELPAGRIWVTLPEFRQAVELVSGPRVVHNARVLMDAIGSRGELGLLGGSFRALSLAPAALSTFAFAAHLGDGRLRKASGGGGGLYGYATSVHGWEHVSRVSAAVVRAGASDPFCADNYCRNLFEAEGARAYLELMFRSDEYAGTAGDPGLARLRHQVSAVLGEIEMVSALPRQELLRMLHGASVASSLSLPAAKLARWVDILSGEVERAA